MSDFLNLTEFSTGGLLDDADATVTRCRFDVWEYDIKKGENAGQKGRKFVIAATFQPEDGEPATQYYSIGNPDNYEAYNEGRNCRPKGKAQQLHAKSQAGQFMASLLNAGVPKSLLAGGDVSTIEGAKLHVNRVPDAEDKNRTLLVATRVVSAPWDGNGKAATASASAKSDALDEKLSATIVALAIATLQANGGTMDKVTLAKKVFQSKELVGTNKKTALDILQNDSFLSDNFAYDSDSKSVTAI